MESLRKKNYSFPTVISMVVGIVIGCGIEFKADDILIAVNGSIALGVLGFLIVGIGILFGALTISEYASQDTEYNGVIGYSRKALGDKFAFIVGWFTIACYFPACIAILAFVSADYLGILLGIDSMLFRSVSSLILIVMCFSINIASARAGGASQIIFTIIKIIPLLTIGLVGSFFFSNTVTSFDPTVATNLGTSSPLSSLISIAFAFDGWIIATNIAKEINNSEKLLPRALIAGIFIIIIVYVLYFYGITQIVSPTEIMQLGNDHTEVAAIRLLGPIGGKLLTLSVVISVYGGLNGIILAYLRLPKNFLDSGLVINVLGKDEKTIEKNAIIVCIIFVAIYFIFQQLLNFQILFSHLEHAFDLSELPIMINYIFYIILFLLANKLVIKKSTFKRITFLIISMIAVLTSSLVVIGMFNFTGLIYVIFSIVVILLGIPFYENKKSQLN